MECHQVFRLTTKLSGLILGLEAVHVFDDGIVHQVNKPLQSPQTEDFKAYGVKKSYSDGVF